MLSNAYCQHFACVTLLAALSGVAVVAAAEQTVSPFSATYKVRYGVLRGEMSLDLSQADGGYYYETSLRPRGIANWLRRGEIRETTTIRLSGGDLQPVDYLNIDTISRPHRRAGYEFDDETRRVTGEYKTKAVDAPWRQGGQNRISVHVAIMHALQDGRGITRLPVFDRGRWRDFEFEINRGQYAETPYGDFETLEIRYTSSDKDKSWSMHCAPDLNYVPVKIVFREDGKIRSRALLIDYGKTGAVERRH